MHPLTRISLALAPAGCGEPSPHDVDFELRGCIQLAVPPGREADCVRDAPRGAPGKRREGDAKAEHPAVRDEYGIRGALAR